MMQSDVTLGMTISQKQKAIAAEKRGLSLSNDNYMQGVRNLTSFASREEIQEPKPYLIRTASGNIDNNKNNSNSNKHSRIIEKEKQD